MNLAHSMARHDAALFFGRQPIVNGQDKNPETGFARKRAMAAVYHALSIATASPQRWLHAAVCLGAMCCAQLAVAADAPDYPIVKKLNHHHAAAKQHAAATGDQIKVASLPAGGVTAAPSGKAGLKDAAATLSWDLAPLVAGADGGKMEGSGGASAQLVASKPGIALGPVVSVELQGFAIKTPKSTIRIDIHVGAMSHTITWGPAVTKSGAFDEVFTEAIPAGTMPDKLNASALALVTKEGDGPAAILTLDKVIVKFAKPAMDGAEK